VTGKIPYSFDFQGYSAFVQHMANLPNFLNRARKQYLETTIRRLTIDHKKLVATTIYKSSNADRRVGNRFIRPNVNDYICTGHNNDTGTNEVETEINEQAIALLNKIQAEVRQDDNTNQISAGDQNAILVAAALTEVMESNEVLQQPDIYQDSTIEQPSEQCTILAFQ
jgi:ABC-type molybdenum transport system ATPase subunit/photorepair protein PhrA